MCRRGRRRSQTHLVHPLTNTAFPFRRIVPQSAARFNPSCDYTPRILTRRKIVAPSGVDAATTSVESPNGTMTLKLALPSPSNLISRRSPSCQTKSCVFDVPTSSLPALSHCASLPGALGARLLFVVCACETQKKRTSSRNVGRIVLIGKMFHPRRRPSMSNPTAATSTAPFTIF